jgi:hypothetical protein
MKYAIYPEHQGTIIASSENPEYPAANLLTPYRKQVWKAVDSVQSATLTVPISSGAVIAVFGTNAVSGSIAIEDDVSHAEILNTAWTIEHGRYWQEYTDWGTAHTAEITLTTTEETLEAGIVRAGELYTLKAPQYGISENLKDFSIKRELASGAYYTKKLDFVRSVSYQCPMNDAQYHDLVDLYEFYGPDPFAMLLTDGAADTQQFAIFGNFEAAPSMTRNYINHLSVAIDITESM